MNLLSSNAKVPNLQNTSSDKLDKKLAEMYQNIKVNV